MSLLAMTLTERHLPKSIIQWIGCLLLVFWGNQLQAQNANFTANQTSGCSPLTVQFTDLSTGTIHEWAWDFGNGNTSSFDDVTATYTTPGTYTVTLTVRDTINGTSSTRTEVNYITVYTEPIASFTYNPASGCAPLTVNFSDASTPGDGAITNWTWDFGDGNLGTGPSPSHTYLTSGTYTVTLVVEDANGCQDTRVENDIVTITDVANVDFSGTPRTGCSAPLRVDFTNNVTPAGTYNFLWNFGDGNTSAAANPTHNYTANGQYTVSLTVTDNNGCSETLSRTDYIIIDQPNADFFAVNTTVCTGLPVSFINNSSGADSYIWNFGDGNTSTAVNPIHTYNVPGTYPVTLTANNSAGCSDIRVRTTYITVNASPAASFNVSNNIGCTNPLVVSFQDNSTGNIVAWDWDFGNGNVSTGQNPITTYTIPGSYTVSLTVTSADGCQSTETIPNIVLLAEPDAEFATSVPTGCVPHTVNFVDLSTSPADPIVSWFWNFGDGNLSAAQNPSHTYTTPGQYTVTLTVTTASGCTNTETFRFVEAGTAPNVNFDANPRVACVGELINFQDLTTGGATDWQWFFGDGTGSNVQNPTHAYQDTGTYDITLITWYLGCSDTLIVPDFISIQGAIADFIFTPNTGCNPPVSVSFFDQSVNADQWFWDFGDGNTSTAQNPTHIYTSVGTFTVTLVATETASGCNDQFIQTIDVTNPVAAFSASPTFGCPDLTVNFTNSSVDANDYFWDFGDGSVSTAANPSHTYTAPGQYDVMLIASDGVCEDTLTFLNLVRLSGPTVDFTASAITGCAPLSVTFTDASTPYPATSLVSWTWDFGDGNTG
ncbi:MAG: PKD domain-containing protein, partial [Bacteroidota bacterium]